MTGNELRDWMKRNRYSIHGLADALGIHASTVQRYRTGELTIPRMLVLALRGLKEEAGP